jgi:hypothetical protein
VGKRERPVNRLGGTPGGPGPVRLNVAKVHVPLSAVLAAAAWRRLAAGGWWLLRHPFAVVAAVAVLMASRFTTTHGALPGPVGGGHPGVATRGMVATSPRLVHPAGPVPGAQCVAGRDGLPVPVAASDGHHRTGCAGRGHRVPAQGRVRPLDRVCRCG